MPMFQNPKLPSWAPAAFGDMPFGLLPNPHDPRTHPAAMMRLGGPVARQPGGGTARGGRNERPAYTPAEVIRSQQSTGDWFQTRPPAAGTVAGNIGTFGNSFMGTFIPTRAEERLRENERISADASRRAISATDLQGTVDALASGDPQQRQTGLQALIPLRVEDERRRNAERRFREFEDAERARQQPQAGPPPGGPQGGFQWPDLSGVQPTPEMGGGGSNMPGLTVTPPTAAGPPMQPPAVAPPQQQAAPQQEQILPPGAFTPFVDRMNLGGPFPGRMNLGGPMPQPEQMGVEPAAMPAQAPGGRPALMDQALRQGFGQPNTPHGPQAQPTPQGDPANRREWFRPRGQQDQASPERQRILNQLRAGMITGDEAKMRMDVLGQRPYEEAYDKHSAQQFSDMYKEMRKDAGTAQRSLNDWRIFEQLASNPNTLQGPGAASISLPLRRLAGTFGIQSEGLDATQLFQAIAGRMALEARNPAGGAGMPGAMSDADREFLQQITGGIGNTREANIALAKIHQRLNQRQVEAFENAMIYTQNNRGRLDGGFDALQASWAARNPLFNAQDYAVLSGQRRPTGGGGDQPSGGVGPYSEFRRNPTTGEIQALNSQTGQVDYVLPDENGGFRPLTPMERAYGMRQIYRPPSPERPRQPPHGPVPTLR